MTVLEPGAHPPTDLQTLATPPLFNREEAVSGMSGGVAAVLGVAGLVGAVIIGFAYGTGMSARKAERDLLQQPGLPRRSLPFRQ
ncbi:MAG: hypothetical protein EB107_07515 [Proteobacteria bacterium]|nr:hypothetical protein [Pseudomonadota bacterium]